MGISEWLPVADVLLGCGRLVVLADFGWSRAVLASGLSRIGLRGAGLGDGDAVVLAALLPRASATLVGLLLGCCCPTRAPPPAA
jgi:hypothetical protein